MTKPCIAAFLFSLLVSLAFVGVRFSEAFVSPIVRSSSFSAAETAPNMNFFDGLQTMSGGKKLIEIAKDYVDTKSGFYSPADPDSYAENFVFRGPYIGPLNKVDYLKTMEAFSLYESIPDLSANSWGYSIDPVDPNRVWFMCRNTGTFTGKPLLPETLNVQPTGDKISGCPETFSIIFDDEQKIKYLSVGYVADRFDGNTNGKGAAVGIFNTIGIKIPDPGPLYKFVTWIGNEVFPSYPRAYSTENIPDWYFREKGNQIGIDGY